jgi:hypothetical protein
MITYRFTVEQFQRLLGVVLSDSAPDDLTNLVLMACTRPKNGVISVPVPLSDARALQDLVQSRSDRDPLLADIARLMAAQAASTLP